MMSLVIRIVPYKAFPIKELYECCSFVLVGKVTVDFHLKTNEFLTYMLDLTGILTIREICVSNVKALQYDIKQTKKQT